MDEKILIIKTINHPSHRPFWDAIKNKNFYNFPYYDNPLLRYIGATKIPNTYDFYIIENTSALGYLRKVGRLKNKTWIPVVADALSFVYLDEPDWYFEKTEIGRLKIPKEIKKIFLKEVIDGYEIVKGIIAVSNLVKKYVKKIVDVPVEVVYPSINPDNLEDLLKSRSNLKRNNIFSIAPAYWKGVDILIKSFEVVLKEYKDSKLYLRTSFDMIKTYWKLMKPLIKSYKLRLITTRIKWSEISKKASVYLQSSYFDPCPVSIFEAGLAGMIPVMTEYTGSHEVYSEFKSLIRRVDPEELAEAAMRILNMEIEEKEKLSKKIKEKTKKMMPDNTRKEFKNKFERLRSKLI